MTTLSLTPGKALKLPTAVLAVTAAPDSKTIFAACMDGGIWAVPLNEGAPTQLGKHTSYASGVQYLSAQNQVLSAGYDGVLRWLDPATGKELRAITAHRFWSWKLRLSPDERYVASATGQYLVGGLKYEPAAEREPSVKVFEAATGKLVVALAHVPPVLSVAFSPDSRHVAAANLMGEIRVWEVATGKQVAQWTTPDFTCWGIIKSHHYIGGIFDLSFAPEGKELLGCGMGPMEDPMAGNGKQTWQRFAWQESTPRKVGQIQESDAGRGLMEALRFHPDGKLFVMAGRLAQGKWNAALFETATGALLHSLDTKMRITDALWLEGGKQLVLVGATGQDKKKDGRSPDFGHLKLFSLRSEGA